MVIGRINGVVALTEFFIRKCMGILPGQKSGHNNEVVVRQGSTVKTKSIHFKALASLFINVKIIDEL